MGRLFGRTYAALALSFACLTIPATPALAQEDDQLGVALIASADLPEDFVLPPADEGKQDARIAYVYPVADDFSAYDHYSSERDRHFRKRVLRREILFQVLNVVDTVQTVDCLNRQVCHEMNPILGRNPSTGKLIGIKALAGGIHALGTHLLREFAPSAVGTFQVTSLIIQSGAVVWNVQHSF